jgi:hypothetical protein
MAYEKKRTAIKNSGMAMKRTATPRITSGAVQGAVTGGMAMKKTATPITKKLKKSTVATKSSGKITKLPYKGGTATPTKMPYRGEERTITKLRNRKKLTP